METISQDSTAIHQRLIHCFDPVSRSWVTAPGQPDQFSAVPALDGEFITDVRALAPLADDFGHLLHRTPLAVLRPGSVEDVVKIVGFARQHSIQIAGRGNGHTTFGQAQAAAGIVVDVSSLRQIHHITAEHAVVDAGVVWRDLLQATLVLGLTPPVLTDYTKLTVGGTLSMGGVSGRSFRYGTQADQVLELQVVTGEGDLITCSAQQQAALFHGVLAGLGLCAIIVRATLKLIAAHPLARTHRFFYPSVQPMLQDLRRLLSREGVDYVRGNAVPLHESTVPPELFGRLQRESAAGFAYFLEATTFYTNESELTSSIGADLVFLEGTEQQEDHSYFAFTDQVVQLLAALDAAGLGHLPHPWLDLLVPNSTVDSFAAQTIAQLDPSSFLPGSLLLFYPFVKAQLQQSLFQAPEEELFFLFDILRTVPADPTLLEEVVAENRRLYEQNRACGGSFYPISAVPMTTDDWRQHFGAYWPALCHVKRHYDPDNVLGAGYSVFYLGT